MKTAIPPSTHRLPPAGVPPDAATLSPRSSKLFNEVHSILDAYSYTEIDSFKLLSSLSFEPTRVDDAVRQIVESYSGHEQGIWKVASNSKRKANNNNGGGAGGGVSPPRTSFGNAGAGNDGNRGFNRKSKSFTPRGERGGGNVGDGSSHPENTARHGETTDKAASSGQAISTTNTGNSGEKKGEVNVPWGLNEDLRGTSTTGAPASNIRPAHNGNSRRGARGASSSVRGGGSAALTPAYRGHNARGEGGVGGFNDAGMASRSGYQSGSKPRGGGERRTSFHPGGDRAAVRFEKTAAGGSSMSGLSVKKEGEAEAAEGSQPSNDKHATTPEELRNETVADETGMPSHPSVNKQFDRKGGNLEAEESTHTLPSTVGDDTLQGAPTSRSFANSSRPKSGTSSRGGFVGIPGIRGRGRGGKNALAAGVTRGEGNSRDKRQSGGGNVAVTHTRPAEAAENEGNLAAESFGNVKDEGDWKGEMTDNSDNLGKSSGSAMKQTSAAMGSNPGFPDLSTDSKRAPPAVLYPSQSASSSKAQTIYRKGAAALAKGMKTAPDVPPSSASSSSTSRPPPSVARIHTPHASLSTGKTKYDSWADLAAGRASRTSPPASSFDHALSESLTAINPPTSDGECGVAVEVEVEASSTPSPPLTSSNPQAAAKSVSENNLSGNSSAKPLIAASQAGSGSVSPQGQEIITESSTAAPQANLKSATQTWPSASTPQPSWDESSSTTNLPHTEVAALSQSSQLNISSTAKTAKEVEVAATTGGATTHQPPIAASTGGSATQPLAATPSTQSAVAMPPLAVYIHPNTTSVKKSEPEQPVVMPRLLNSQSLNHDMGSVRLYFGTVPTNATRGGVFSRPPPHLDEYKAAPSTREDMMVLQDASSGVDNTRFSQLQADSSATRVVSAEFGAPRANSESSVSGSGNAVASSGGDVSRNSVDGLGGVTAASMNASSNFHTGSGSNLGIGLSSTLQSVTDSVAHAAGGSGITHLQVAGAPPHTLIPSSSSSMMHSSFERQSVAAEFSKQTGIPVMRQPIPQSVNIAATPGTPGMLVEGVRDAVGVSTASTNTSVFLGSTASSLQPNQAVVGGASSNYAVRTPPTDLGAPASGGGAASIAQPGHTTRLINRANAPQQHERGFVPPHIFRHLSGGSSSSAAYGGVVGGLSAEDADGSYLDNSRIISGNNLFSSEGSSVNQPAMKTETLTHTQNLTGGNLRPSPPSMGVTPHGSMLASGGNRSANTTNNNNTLAASSTAIPYAPSSGEENDQQMHTAGLSLIDASTTTTHSSFLGAAEGAGYHQGASPVQHTYLSGGNLSSTPLLGLSNPMQHQLGGAVGSSSTTSGIAMAMSSNNQLASSRLPSELSSASDSAGNTHTQQQHPGVGFLHSGEFIQSPPSFHLPQLPKAISPAMSPFASPPHVVASGSNSVGVSSVQATPSTVGGGVGGGRMMNYGIVQGGGGNAGSGAPNLSHHSHQQQLQQHTSAQQQQHASTQQQHTPPLPQHTSTQQRHASSQQLPHLQKQHSHTQQQLSQQQLPQAGVKHVLTNAYKSPYQSSSGTSWGGAPRGGSASLSSHTQANAHQSIPPQPSSVGANVATATSPFLHQGNGYFNKKGGFGGKPSLTPPTRFNSMSGSDVGPTSSSSSGPVAHTEASPGPWDNAPTTVGVGHNIGLSGSNASGLFESSGKQHLGGTGGGFSASSGGFRGGVSGGGKEDLHVSSDVIGGRGGVGSSVGGGGVIYPPSAQQQNMKYSLQGGGSNAEGGKYRNTGPSGGVLNHSVESGMSQDDMGLLQVGSFSDGVQLGGVVGNPPSSSEGNPSDILGGGSSLSSGISRVGKMLPESVGNRGGESQQHVMGGVSHHHQQQGQSGSSNLFGGRGSKSVVHSSVQTQDVQDKGRFNDFRSPASHNQQRDPSNANTTHLLGKRGVSTAAEVGGSASSTPSMSLMSSSSMKASKGNNFGSSFESSHNQAKYHYQQQQSFSNNHPSHPNYPQNQMQYSLYDGKSQVAPLNEGMFDNSLSSVDSYNYGGSHLVQHQGHLSQGRTGNLYNEAIPPPFASSLAEHSAFSSQNMSGISSNANHFNTSYVEASGGNLATSSFGQTSSKFSSSRQGTSSKSPLSQSDVAQSQKVLQNTASTTAQLTHHDSPLNQQQGTPPYYTTGAFAYSSAPPGLTPVNTSSLPRPQQFNYPFAAGMVYPYNGVTYNTAYPQHMIHNYVVGSPFAGKGGHGIHSGYPPNQYTIGYGEGFDESLLGYGNAQSTNDLSMNFGNIQTSYEAGVSGTLGLSNSLTHSQNNMSSFSNTQDQRWPANTFEAPASTVPNFSRSSSSSGFVSNATEANSAGSFYFANSLRMSPNEDLSISSIGGASGFVGGGISQGESSFNPSLGGNGWDAQQQQLLQIGGGGDAASYGNSGTPSQSSQSRNNTSKHNYSYMLPGYPVVNVRNAPAANVNHPHRGSLGNDQNSGYLGYGNFATQHSQYAAHNPPGLTGRLYTASPYLQASGHRSGSNLGPSFNGYNSSSAWGNQ